VLLDATRFTLAEPGVYRHTATPRAVEEGWLVTLRVDPTYQQPHPTHTPVLWVGEQAAVRVSWRSSCAVAWVPGRTDPRTVPIFYASVELPERLTPADGRAWRARAEAAGIAPQPAEERPVRRFSTFTALMRHAAALDCGRFTAR
jgi:hypothetical protein